jgi:hypothetical protein
VSDPLPLVLETSPGPAEFKALLLCKRRLLLVNHKPCTIYVLYYLIHHIFYQQQKNYWL